MKVKLLDYLGSAMVGVSLGVILVGGAMLQERGVTPLGNTVVCMEDDPCWDSKTMGDGRQGMVNDPEWENYPEDYTVCRWDGSAWKWAYSPVDALNLPCPFNYS